MKFPDKFTWGAASSSYQIEGAAAEDGKGPSIWDVFCKHSGRVFKGHTGAIACDHYHRYREDVALMKKMGLPAYRFSISWPRVMPDGAGRINEKGLDFYDRLVDALCAAGIDPYITLFHWDLPQALYARGSWMNRDIAEQFADYAGIVTRRLGDRVGHWITINEPTITLICGYWEGSLAPGDKLLASNLLLSIHNLLLAHGRAVQSIRAASPRPTAVGWTHACAPSIPATNNPRDIAAARTHFMAIPDDPHAGEWHTTSWFNDPVYLGRYPREGLRTWSSLMPAIAAGDMRLINQDLDFCGLNIYHSHKVQASRGGPEKIPWESGRTITLSNWPVTPEAHYWGPRFMFERYKKPVYIFESGMACTDIVSADGRVHDAGRIEYHRRYLGEIARAVKDGVDLRGYFIWSVIDVMEWSDGYKQRFGLIHVDRETLKRTPKDSFDWYRKVIRTNGRGM